MKCLRDIHMNILKISKPPDMVEFLQNILKYPVLPNIYFKPILSLLYSQTNMFEKTQYVCYTNKCV